MAPAFRICWLRVHTGGRKAGSFGGRADVVTVWMDCQTHLDNHVIQAPSNEKNPTSYWVAGGQELLSNSA